MRKVWSGLVAALTIAGMSSPASAAYFDLGAGLKWVPVRYTMPVSVVGASDKTDLGQEVGLSGWPTTFDPYVAFFFHPQFAVTLGLGFGYAAHHDQWDSARGLVGSDQGSLCVSNDRTCDLSYTTFGFNLGAKYYLTRPAAQKVVPYVAADFFKYFATISTSDPVQPERASAIAGLHSPLGFNVAFGAEYYFTNAFSVGAEILGLQFSYSQGNWPDVAGFDNEIKNQSFALYSGITLNYRFLTSSASKSSTSDDDEDRTSRSKRRHRRDDDGGNPPDSDVSVD